MKRSLKASRMQQSLGEKGVGHPIVIGVNHLGVVDIEGNTKVNRQEEDINLEKLIYDLILMRFKKQGKYY